MFDRSELLPAFRKLCASARVTSHEPLSAAALRLESGDVDTWDAWERDELILSAARRGELSIDAMRAFVGQASIGGERACRHIASYPHAPPDVLATLAKDPRWRVQEAVASHPTTPHEALEDLTRVEDPAPRWVLAGRGDIDQAILCQLAIDADVHVRERLAGGRLAPEAQLILARNHTTSVRRVLAANPLAEEDILRRLADDPLITVRLLAVLNPSAPATMLVDLARAPSAVLRRAIASAPKSSGDVLRELTHDPDVEVRFFVAANPEAPHDVLAQLSVDPDGDVRRAVASNRRASPSLLDPLLHDEAISVRLTIASRSDCDTWAEILAKDPSDGVRGVFARKTSSSAALEHLAQDQSSTVRRYVAENPMAPAEVQRSLATDPSDAVRAAVAANPSAVESVLAELAQDPSRSVASRLAQRPKKLSRGPTTSPTSSIWSPSVLRLLELASSESEELRREVARDHATPDPILDVLAKERSPTVCATVLGNREVESAIVDELLGRRSYLRSFLKELHHAPFRLRTFPTIPLTPFELDDD